MTRPLIILVESLDGDSLYKSEREIEALGEILSCLKMDVVKRNVFGYKHLQKAIRLATKEDAAVFHLSCHGAPGGIGLLNGDERTWPELADDLCDLAAPDRVLTLSTCWGGVKGISPELTNQNTPFGYIFGPKEKISIPDGCIAWAIIYRTIQEHGLTRQDLQQSIEAINDLLPGKFVYRRWDPPDKIYKKFGP